MPLAVTMGDPAGIGLEIAIRAWMARRRYDIPPFVLIANQRAVDDRLRALGGSGSAVAIGSAAEGAGHFTQRLPVLDQPLAREACPGRPDPANAPAVIAVIETAVDLVRRGEAAAVVTNPISKAVLKEAGFAHPGHTEFLGVLARKHWPGFSGEPVMMLASDELRTVPLTVHIPLKDVPGALSQDLIVATIRTTAAALKRDFAIAHPRIAVCGLNPHAGESGTMGREEVTLIAPALARLRAEGLDVRGPLPADTLFHAAARRTYDAVVAMYHDQALIPLKTLAFDRGVNVTLGLPFVRTSPDHGTAFDIAGRFEADPSSFLAALAMAARMAAARRVTADVA